jgi:alpha-tubulin suppressor-like RCC1 family protein
LYCWGANTSGQLGDGTTIDRMTPVLAGSGRSFFMASAGGSHTCGVAAQSGPPLTGSGDAYCWGSNSNGQLGDGAFGQLGNGNTTDSSVPVKVSGQ